MRVSTDLVGQAEHVIAYPGRPARREAIDRLGIEAIGGEGAPRTDDLGMRAGLDVEILARAQILGLELEITLTVRT